MHFPFFVEYKNLNMSDMYFSQGDDKLEFCSGFFELKFETIRGGIVKYLTLMGPTLLHLDPDFEIGHVELRFFEWLVFEGINVDVSGCQNYLDTSISFEGSSLNAIYYLFKLGNSKEQSCFLLSCCPCEVKLFGNYWCSTCNCDTHSSNYNC